MQAEQQLAEPGKHLGRGDGERPINWYRNGIGKEEKLLMIHSAVGKPQCTIIGYLKISRRDAFEYSTHREMVDV